MANLDALNKLMYRSYDQQGRHAMEGLYYSITWSYLIALR